MEKYHVLVVEDDIEIANAIKIYLQNQGYDVYVGNDGIEGLEIVEKETIHLAIVDIMMPRMDGLTMVAKLREKYDFPVIFLSAKSEDIDKIMGLNLGGDDYVTKPFVPMELMARVRSHLRRYGRYLDATAPKESDSIYLCGGLELNVDTKTVSVDGKKVKVTPIEFKMLWRVCSIPRYIRLLNYLRLRSRFLSRWLRLLISNRHKPFSRHRSRW